MAVPRPPYSVSGQDASIADCYVPELTIAPEFLTVWLPLVTHDLCPACSRVLSHRVHCLPQCSGPALRNMDVPAPLNDDTCMEAVDDLVQDSAETPPSCDNCDSSSLVNSANELSETVKSGRSVEMMVDVPFVCMSHVGVSSKKDELADQKSVGNPQPTIDKYEYDTNDAVAKMRKNRLSLSENKGNAFDL